jgi:nucleoside-diphosphate-sugar epimerase
MNNMILVAGATGNLGERIVKALLQRGAQVRIIVRTGSNIEKIEMFETLGVQVFKIDNWCLEDLAVACKGVHCVVSSLAGLRNVVVDTQKILLDAAIIAGVPRFIPSDYSLDFTRFSYGENRNLDLRREFHEYLDGTSIEATSIFNGAFTELLTGDMPMIIYKKRLILYWGNADRRWDFTTMNDTAAYTACVALDANTPRFLRIAGDRISPREVKAVVTEVTGQKFRMFRAGGKALLEIIIKMARTFAPAENELYPAWQGMQYMHNMIDDRSKIDMIDNDRYPEVKWTSVKHLLKDHEEKRNAVN